MYQYMGWKKVIVLCELKLLYSDNGFMSQIFITNILELQLIKYLNISKFSHEFSLPTVKCLDLGNSNLT